MYLISGCLLLIAYIQWRQLKKMEDLEMLQLQAQTFERNCFNWHKSIVRARIEQAEKNGDLESK